MGYRSSTRWEWVLGLLSIAIIGVAIAVPQPAPEADREPLVSTESGGSETTPEAVPAQAPGPTSATNEAVVISARIDNYDGTTRTLEKDHDGTVQYHFTNTGTVTHIFGAGATLRKPDNSEADLPLQTRTLAPGESATVNWSHTYNDGGFWDLRVSVWKESSEPLSNRLADSGWLDSYIVEVLPVRPTYSWVNVYSLHSTLDGSPLPVDSVVEAYDRQGTILGRTLVSHDGCYGVMPLYQDDPQTPVDEGAEPGDLLFFLVNGFTAEVVGPDRPVWTANGDLLELDLIVASSPK